MKTTTTEMSEANFAIVVGALGQKFSESKTAFRGTGAVNPMKMNTTERQKATFAILVGALSRQFQKYKVFYRCAWAINPTILNTTEAKKNCDCRRCAQSKISGI